MILVTGATGYIGSHMCLRLIEDGHKIVMLDNLQNSSIEAYVSIVNYAMKCGLPKPEFSHVDLSNDLAVYDFSTGSEFIDDPIDTIFHFAGLKSVTDSVKDPVLYMKKNLCGTMNLLDRFTGKVDFIFSSSASVYQYYPTHSFSENDPVGPLSPYGSSKAVSEKIIEMKALSSGGQFHFASLRYFNPVGCHSTGLIGEVPTEIPNNLMPYIAQVAKGERPELTVYGTDYNTPDGTTIRDYIHVMDLVDGHMDAWRYIKDGQNLVANLGTGKGTSVLEMIKAYEECSGRKIPFKIAGRRPGDYPRLVANVSRAEKLLGWKATRTLNDMCIDSWKFKGF